MMHVHLRMGTCVRVCVCLLSFCCCCVASWASPKHDLRGSACCVCMCEPDRAEPASAPRLGWRPSDGGRRRGRSSSLAVHASSMPGEPKSASAYKLPREYGYGTRLLRVRPQQPPPKAPKAPDAPRTGSAGATAPPTAASIRRTTSPTTSARSAWRPCTRTPATSTTA